MEDGPLLCQTYVWIHLSNSRSYTLSGQCHRWKCSSIDLYGERVVPWHERSISMFISLFEFIHSSCTCCVWYEESILVFFVGQNGSRPQKLVERCTPSSKVKMIRKYFYYILIDKYLSTLSLSQFYCSSTMIRGNYKRSEHTPETNREKKTTSKEAGIFCIDNKYLVDLSAQAS